MKSILMQNPIDCDSGTFRPQLTSLIDVMTILLVFLIKSFSAEGNLITPASEVALPLSRSEDAPAQIPTLAISTDAVLWNGRAIARVKDIESSDSLLVAPLFATLVRYRRENSVRDKRLLIQADRSLAFAVIKKAMYSSSKAGFADFEILVTDEG